MDCKLKAISERRQEPGRRRTPPGNPRQGFETSHKGKINSPRRTTDRINLVENQLCSKEAATRHSMVVEQIPSLESRASIVECATSCQAVSGSIGEEVMRLLFALLSLATALAGAARIAGAQDCIAQTWKGTIGAVPVMMQFDYIGEDSSLAGRYYYRTSIVDLLLVSDSTKPDRWKELDPKGTVTGYLTLSCKENSLSGTWSSPDGSKTLPISAEVQPEDSFSRQRLAGLKTTATKRGTVGKSKYELFTAQGFGAVKGLRLMGDGKIVADINSALMERFTNRLDEAIDCIASGRWQRGEEHGYYYESEMSMIAWNEAFVVIGESYSQYCGGVHPLAGAGATTYGLQTGKAEDASQWLIDRYRKEIPKGSPLGKIIMELYSQEDECADSIELSGEYVWPASTGITFQPMAPYISSACIQDITVPYKSMSPYLSPLGKTNVQAFQSR